MWFKSNMAAKIAMLDSAAIFALRVAGSGAIAKSFQYDLSYICAKFGACVNLCAMTYLCSLSPQLIVNCILNVLFLFQLRNISKHQHVALWQLAHAAQVGEPPSKVSHGMWGSLCQSLYWSQGASHLGHLRLTLPVVSVGRILSHTHSTSPLT